MRKNGTLVKWNDERGFGFISSADGGKDLFVHISAFPRDGQRPRIDEPVSFEVATGTNGKLQAVRVLRPGQSLPPRREQVKRSPQRSRRRRLPAVIALLAVAAIGALGYVRLNKPRAPSHAGTWAATTPATAAPSDFHCDGRTMCSQMRSCAEARYFLQHCPNTKMDGDRDSEPCEQQWCH